MASNGAIPLDQLTPIGGGFYLQHNTAASFVAMRAACQDATGVVLVPSPGDGAYRTLDEQQYELDLWRQNGSSGTRPANPGYSNHGWGTAIDIYNWRAAASWLSANAGRFNFTRPFGDEPWHFQYVGAITADVSPATSTRRARSRTVSLYHLQDSKPTLYALAGDSPGTPANWLETTAQSLANAWSDQIGGPSAEINQKTWDQYKADYRAPLTTNAQIAVGGVKLDNSEVVKRLDALPAAIVKVLPKKITATLS